MTIFGHKIALFFPQLLTTNRDLISIKEGQNSRFKIFKTNICFHDYYNSSVNASETILRVFLNAEEPADSDLFCLDPVTLPGIHGIIARFAIVGAKVERIGLGAKIFNFFENFKP